MIILYEKKIDNKNSKTFYTFKLFPFFLHAAQGELKKKYDFVNYS